MTVFNPSLLAAIALAPFAAADTTPQAVEKKAAAIISEATLRASIKFLASDLLEGRAPGTRGDALAQAYIAAELEALGLEPAAPGGGFLQKVPLVGVTAEIATPLTFTGGGRTFAPERTKEYVVNAGTPTERLQIRDAEVVFVGYGVVAPEYDWDDYRDVDVRGKVVLIMNNDPEHDPKLFAGRTRLYYGRWTYKYEEAARHGAAAAIVIHTTPSAAYPWQVVQSSWSGEQFELPSEGEPRMQAKMWTTDEATKRIVALGSHDLDQLRAAAQRPGFRAVSLGVRMSIGLTNRVVRAESANVLARLPGRDPRKAGEAVLYTAHHDHLGIRTAAAGEDALYNGAVDNATGVAALLAIARAYAALPDRPPRSILFAAVAGEEQGLLGSTYLARNLPIPAGRIAAAINLDAMNIFGRTRDVTVVGFGKSTLDDLLAGLARSQGRTVKEESFPERGSYYRSDHFPLAKGGVPAIYPSTGTDFVGRPAEWGREAMDAWLRQHYHQPSDEWRDDFDLSGMVEDTRLFFYFGAKIAAARELPHWLPGDEFEAARARALQAAGAAP